VLYVGYRRLAISTISRARVSRLKGPIHLFQPCTSGLTSKVEWNMHHHHSRTPSDQPCQSKLDDERDFSRSDQNFALIILARSLVFVLVLRLMRPEPGLREFRNTARACRLVSNDPSIIESKDHLALWRRRSTSVGVTAMSTTPQVNPTPRKNDYRALLSYLPELHMLRIVRADSPRCGQCTWRSVR